MTAKVRLNHHSQNDPISTMSVYYLTGFFLLLLLVAGYMFLSHSLEKRRIRRQRLITALKARRNSFRDLATGFPAGFLPKDLSAFLYKSLIDACEQLAILEPKELQHLEQASFYNTQLNSLQIPEAGTRPRLDNPQQLKEARHLLQELHKFILQQTKLQQITQVQASVYMDQIKRLVLQMSVDGHVFNARQAQQAGKNRLAIHYYSLARKLLASENAGQNFEKQIAQLDAVIAKLEEKALAAGELAKVEEDENSQAEVNKEWETFNKENEDWKKKQIYD